MNKGGFIMKVKDIKAYEEWKANNTGMINILRININQYFKQEREI